MSNRSKYWNLSTTRRDQSKCWNFSEKGRLIKCDIYIAKVGNVWIWLKNKELIRILKLRTNFGNQSKCWNLSTNHQIVQNVVFWLKSRESIKKLTFECNKVGIDQNVKIWAKKGRWIKCWYSVAKVEIYQIIGIWLKNKNWSDMKFEDNIRNRSQMLKFECKMWIRFEETTIINHNVEIWVQMWESMEMFKIEGKRGDWSNVDILLQKWESIKMLEFGWKIRNWSEYWNLSTTRRDNQNVEIWVKKGRLIKCWYFIAKVGIDQNVGI